MPMVIYFDNIAQVALFECELKGQISDGHWENAAVNPWRDWCNAECRVAVDGVVGRTFSTTYDKYQLNSSSLLEVVGDRMIAYVKFARLGVPVSEIERLVSGFCGLGGVFTGLPTYEGDYWDKKREYLRRWNAEWVKEVLADDSYTMQDLKADLKRMKEIIRTRV